MIYVNILTKGFETSNSQVFLFPLLLYKYELRSMGIIWRLFTQESEDLYDCDVLIIESRFHSEQWSKNTEGVLSYFCSYKEKVRKVFYFDISDSSGWDHARVLPYVDGYFKNQVLKDKTQYLRPMYGYRPYTDYYHKKYKIIDIDGNCSEPVNGRKLLDKIKVGWNSALANHSFMGRYRMELQKRIPFASLLKLPKNFVSPSVNRTCDISCQIGTRYPRETIAWQRKNIRARLNGRVSFKMLSRKKYFRELSKSKIVVSPFGFGEICYRDYETLLSGAILLKPDMSHIDTWPALYKSGTTIRTHRWDLQDFEEVIEDTLGDYSNYQDIAQNGQQLYKQYLIGPGAREAFCTRFQNILSFYPA